MQPQLASKNNCPALLTEVIKNKSHSEKEKVPLWLTSLIHFLTVAFQVLDRDSDGYMSYHELFSLFRMVTGSTLTDDQVLAVITSILSRSDLQQASRLTFEEFTKVR